MANAGSLDFTLGLNAAGAIANLQAVIGRLAGLAAGALSVGAAFRAMETAVDKGGALYDMSKRTGASVGALYQMQEALQQIGESADNAGSLLTKMQRIAGSDEGRKKLAALGLGTNAGIGEVAGALGKLAPNAQTAAAFGLFGQGAQSMLAIARSAEDFQQAMGEAGRDAQVWQANAERFDALGDKITALKSRVGTFFAEAAGWVFDLVDVVNNSINEGRYFELLGEGFKGLFNFVVDNWVAASELMGAAFYDELAKAIAQVASLVANLPGIGTLAGPLAAMTSAGLTSAAEMRRGFAADYAASANTAFDPFKALWNEFKSPERKAIGPSKDGTEPKSEADTKRPDVTDLEKMGFVFSGAGANPLLDASRRTARATEQIAKNTAPSQWRRTADVNAD